MKYRHSFHAGNFADVHKHVTLVALLDALLRKDAGFLYVDTHAGRGSYALDPAQAEWRDGIGKVLGATPRSPELVRWLALGCPKPATYLGSPMLAAAVLRELDRAALYESDPVECAALRESLAARARTHVACSDGYQAIKALLPPPQRRGLIFIDPPYEEPADFERVGEALTNGLQRFATGVFCVWAPIKHLDDLERWVTRLARRITRPLLLSQLWRAPRDARASLAGSALLIVNPPWRIEDRMRAWLPELQRILADNSGAGSAVSLIAPPAV
ncbi:MAG: 23S rRNA (adenine(2030)-N(6))-methyltransferase RlmJ [Pseudomonadales bacterium]|nr:23S rRNA (adenine(2030)-N(6))-methyltransferase RlmJ [Pseudomonadales bacterium]